MKFKSIYNVINSGYCLGCGLCHVIKKDAIISEKKGKFVSNIITNTKGHISVCPAAGYDIINLGKEIHSSEKYVYELGWYNSIKLVQSLDKSILEKASSGGAMTTIALYMLDSGKADGVICTKYSYDNNIPRPVSFIAHTKEELLQAQGSKYCPTSTLSVLDKLNTDKKYVLIGTPCQIAGWRKYQKKYCTPINVVLTIANFCGGYRDFREIDYFVHSVAGFSKIKYFQHRGDGVPGQMKIINLDGKVWSCPYPDYAHLSPFAKNKRCVFCIDATGELADISCGDVWIDRIKSTGQPWSSVILRNKNAESIMNEIIESNLVKVGCIDESEVIASQKLNITSKKYRQFKRIRIQNLLLQYVPDWYGCIKNDGGSYFKEFKILCSKYLSSKLHVGI